MTFGGRKNVPELLSLEKGNKSFKLQKGRFYFKTCGVKMNLKHTEVTH